MNFLLSFILHMAARVTTPAPKPQPQPVEQPRKLNLMVASFYATPYHGRPTASGEIYNMNDLTAAHPYLKFGTKLKCSLGDRSVVVRINDRGPFIGGRDLDLSRAAAVALGMVGAGVAVVDVEVVS